MTRSAHDKISAMDGARGAVDSSRPSGQDDIAAMQVASPPVATVGPSTVEMDAPFGLDKEMPEEGVWMIQTDESPPMFWVRDIGDDEWFYAAFETEADALIGARMSGDFALCPARFRPIEEVRAKFIADKAYTDPGRNPIQGIALLDRDCNEITRMYMR